jgi:hypothetical protein
MNCDSVPHVDNGNKLAKQEDLTQLAVILFATLDQFLYAYDSNPGLKLCREKLRELVHKLHYGEK